MASPPSRKISGATPLNLSGSRHTSRYASRPVGELTTNGHQQSLAQFLRKAGKRTLREAIVSYASSGASVDLVGSPDAVAAQMAEAMQEVGGDGFLLSMGNVSRRTTAEIADGLVPVLQQRGLTRKAYAHKHLRDNLLEF